MTDVRHAPSPSEPERTAVAGIWTTLFEDLLRGLVHGLNNRLTALSAFAELAAMDGETLELDQLRHEIARLHGVSSLIAVLASRNPELVALELRPLLELALSIHAHHPRMGSAACALEQTGIMQPVRVPRWALLRLFLLLVDAAKRAGAASNVSPASVRLSGDESLVRACIVSPEPPGEYAASLAQLCGGRLVSDGDTITLELPSLLELRKREHAV